VAAALLATPAQAEWFVQHLAPTEDAIMEVVEPDDRAMTNAYVDDEGGAHRIEISCAPDGEFLGLGRVGEREPFLGGPEAEASVSFDGGEPLPLGTLRYVDGMYFARLPSEIREGIAEGLAMTLALDPGGTLAFTLRGSGRALREMMCFEG
jgi:hypothetical protein